MVLDKCPKLKNRGVLAGLIQSPQILCLRAMLPAVFVTGQSSHDNDHSCYIGKRTSECTHVTDYLSSHRSAPHRRQADLQLHERVLSQLICHLMLPTFFLPGFRKSGPFPLPLKTSQIGYIPRSLAKSDDSHITIPRLNNSCQMSSLNFSNSSTGIGL